MFGPRSESCEAFLLAGKLYIWCMITPDEHYIAYAPVLFGSMQSLQIILLTALIFMIRVLIKKVDKLERDVSKLSVAK